MRTSDTQTGLAMDLKNTIFLPKTDFPMRGNLAEKEPGVLSAWKSNDLYTQIREKSQGREKFILHFGPPYANGHMHMGHALSEVLKDILNKIKQMQGFDAPMVPGWDCHGLPIEWQVEKNYQAKGLKKDDIDVIEFRKECRDFAAKWVEVQRAELQRLGIVADWSNPYLTMDFKAEAAIVKEIMTLLDKGLIVRGMRPVMWSVIEKTALAEAEVEYKDHVSDAVYVGFPITHAADADVIGAKAVIWTTTPWSLPGNRAICFGDFEYVLLSMPALENLALSGQKILLAKDLHESVLKEWGVEGAVVLKTIPGRDLSGAIAEHPFKHMAEIDGFPCEEPLHHYDFDVPFYMGSHVTTDAGTGLVHTAPTHGMDDYLIGRAHHLDVPNTVADDGVYTGEAPFFTGIHVFKAAPFVLDVLRGKTALIHHSKLTHSYPHSWRSKAPIIFRATPQWFMDVAKVREQTLSAIANTRFVPEQGRSRITAMVENRPDWCISRQRAWGTPLTLIIDKQTYEPIHDAAMNARILSAIETHGADAWYTTPISEFLGDGYDADRYTKVTDVVDVWLDSGCSHAFVLEARPELSSPADVYFEGSDQHRGWFQSSLWHSVGTRGRAPYKDVITHGFILDEHGYKMSKSSGNGMDPLDIVNVYGADILRLWVASVDYQEDVRIGKKLLTQMQDVYRRFRNTLRYLLGALEGFDEKTEWVAHHDLPELEQYILSRVYAMDQLMKKTATTYDFAGFYHHLHNFCNNDLSAFYFDIRKDSLYCDDTQNITRRSTRTVMHIVFESITRWLAPVLSFTAEEAYTSRYPHATDSIHMQTFYDMPDAYHQPDLETRWERFRHYRKAMTGALEVARAGKLIGSSLQASMIVHADTSEIAEFLKDFQLNELTITSKAELMVQGDVPHAYVHDGVEGISVSVIASPGDKCERCWVVHEDVVPRQTVNDTHLCDRCYDVVSQ